MKAPGFRVNMLKIRKNEVAQKTSWFSKIISGAVGDADYISLYNYSFSGTDLILEEYTGNEPNRGPVQKLNLADIIYDLSPVIAPITDSVAGTISFVRLGEEEPQQRKVADLRKEILEHHIINRTFILGTDRLGRDMLSRMIIGIRISLSVGFIAVFISLFIGLLLGSLAGYFRGWVDELIMWFINVVWSIPTLLLVIAITLVLGKGFWQVFVAVGLTMWVEVARMVRGQVLSLREKEFIEAGRALGYKHNRIILKHVIPNVMGPVIVIAASNFATAILTEAGLSFLGIGAQPPVASWGKMISDHKTFLFTADAFYLAYIPGLAIMILVLAFMLAGNGLRDALDTKSSHEKAITVS